MIPHSRAFAAALDKQIRDVGLCYIKITFADETELEIDNYQIEQLETRTQNDPLSRRLPVETATLTLLDFEESWHPDSPDSVIQKFDEPATAIVKIGIMIDGEPEWTDPCQYIINQRPTWANYRATISMTRRLGSLVGDFYEFEPGSYMLMSALANAVFAKAGDGGNHTYDIALNTFVVYQHSVLPVCPVQDALLAIAVATRGSLLTDNTGIIHVTERYSLYPSKNPSVVKLADMFERPVAQRLPKIRNEIIDIRHNPSTTPEDVTVIDFESSDMPDGSGDTFIEFDVPAASALTFAPTSETNILSSTFRTYKTGLVPIAITRADNTRPYRILADATPVQPNITAKTYVIDATGQEDEEVDNELINKVHSGDIALFRGNYLKNTRSMYTFSYRGDPTIEALDLIRVELPYEGVCTCIVIENVFTYKNGFSGTLTVRKLDVVSQTQAIVSAVSDEAVSDEAVSDEA